MKKVSFRSIKDTDINITLDLLFDILHGNMSIIAPTGESYDDDKAMWVSGVTQALTNPNRSIVIINSGDETIGFFMYSVSSNLLKMEEIQFVPEFQGNGVFRALFNYLFNLIPEEVEHVEAFANKKNIKSQRILEHLKLENVGENKNGNSYRYYGEYQNMKDVISRN